QGNGPGKLEDVNVKDDGTVQAVYSNGETEDEYQLRLAQFANEGALQREGNNLYSAPDAAGKTEGWPGSGSSVGTIRSNSLEQSNVDIAKQFTDMITTQRAYQANSRVISTTKDMLQEVINLTR
ncbi:MAG: flagellar hook-basal body complex protein, partial [Desulfohalobiaceae bacterium]|nr:flagellar hook-basal body complex protein [Desulfohalobiaceae bacterium]